MNQETFRFEAVLIQAFNQLAEDATAQALAKDLAVTIICEVNDIPRIFILTLADGQIRWSHGDFEPSGDIYITICCEPLRKILIGDLGLLEAVLNGELSFRGGVPSAVGFDRLLPCLREAFCASGGRDLPVQESAVFPIRATSALAANFSILQRSRPRILITALIDESSRHRLSQYGDVEYQSFPERFRLLSGAKLAEALKGIDVFVTEVDQVRSSVINEAADLKVIATCHSEPVNIDVAACAARGIPVVCTPGRDANGVAQLAVCFILMLVRRIPAAMRFLNGVTYSASAMAQSFFSFQGTELDGKTVGLVGFGRVARAVCARIKPFGPRILAYDPLMDPNFAASQGAELVELEHLIRESDVISLHAPVLPETRGLINRDRIALMKPNAVLINTARAALTDEIALAEALKEGRIAGGAFDVFSQEPPPPDHPLLHLDNVITTPHIGGNTEEVISRQSQMATDDLLALFEGRPPRYVVNPEVLPNFRWPWPIERATTSG